MKFSSITTRFAIILLLGFVAIFAWNVTLQTFAADDLAAQASAASAARPVRAIWVEAQSAELRSRKNCDDLINRLRSMNVDDIFVEVHALGFAWYHSSLAPSPTGMPADFSDPLGAVLELAHRPGQRSLRVHVVLNLLTLYDDALPFDPPKEHALNLHAQWVSRDYLGNSRDKNRKAYLDPGVPAVQDYITSVVQEVVTRYPVDGVHLTEFRYPGLEKDWGYNSLAIHQYQLDTKPADEKPDKDSDDWARWRSLQLTKTLHRMSDAAHQSSSTLVFSVSGVATGDLPDTKTGGIPDYQKALQDWPRWANGGLMDWLVLEDFLSQDTQDKQFLQWLNFGRQQKGKAKLILAVSGSKNMDSGVLNQMRIALANEVDGVLLYSYQKPALNLAAGANFLDLLGKTVFSPSYVLPSYVHDAIISETAAQKVETIADVAMPIDLPQPVPLTEPTTEPEPVAVAVVAAANQSDAGRALVGSQYNADNRINDTAPEDDIEKLRNVPPPPDPDAGIDWLQVKMKNGTSFVGQRLTGDTEATVYQVRKSRAMVRLLNNLVLESSPYLSTK